MAGLNDVAAIADITAGELRRAFGYHLCAVIRVRDDDCVEALAVRGVGFDALQVRGWSQPREQGLIGRCLRDRTPGCWPMLCTPMPTTTRRRRPATSAPSWSSPLLVDSEVWGAINVEELQPDAFDHDDVILLSTLANQVAAALRAATLSERLTVAERALARALGGGAKTPA